MPEVVTPVRSRLPLVSVVIPTWNGARLLPQAIRSVLEQEGVGEEFGVEVIVVDDGSPDDTPSVVRHFPQVRYLRLDVNRGVCGAQNAGFELATGDYVAYLGDDDLWLPHKLRLQLPLIEARPDAAVVYGQNLVSRGDRLTVWPPDHAPSGRIFEKLLMAGVVPVRTALIRRAAHTEVGGFDESLRCYEADDLFLRLAFRHPFVFQPGPVAIYRRFTTGLYLRAIEDGSTRRDASAVVEKALALLPADDTHNALRARARAAVARNHAWELCDLQAWGRLGDYLVDLLDRWPELPRAIDTRGTVARLLVRCAAESPAPIETLSALEARCGGSRSSRLWADAWPSSTP